MTACCEKPPGLGCGCWCQSIGTTGQPAQHASEAVVWCGEANVGVYLRGPQYTPDLAARMACSALYVLPLLVGPAW